MKNEDFLLREKYHGNKTDAYFSDVQKLQHGEPLAYIIGNIPFLHATIDLSYRPLIPRTETEYWVEKAISYIRQTTSIKDISFLDVFSGSGCIGISLLQALPKASVDFAERDSMLLEQIARNIAFNGLEKRNHRILQSDVFENIAGRYHYIFANPPYLTKKRIDSIDDSVLRHEPHEALFATDDGLFYLKKLIDEYPQYLEDHGTLFVEFDHPQKESLEQYLQESGHANFECWKDQYDKWRVLLLHNKHI